MLVVSGRVCRYRVQEDIEERILSQDDIWRYVGSGEDIYRMRTVVPSRMIQWECYWV